MYTKRDKWQTAYWLKSNLYFLTRLINYTTVTKSKISQYSSKIRNFSSTLHYSSPKAYNYLCKFFNLAYPIILRKWISTFDCMPGYAEEAFTELRSRVAIDCSKYKYCSLDKMAITKHIAWDKSKSKFMTFVDKSDGIQQEAETTTGWSTWILEITVRLFFGQISCFTCSRMYKAIIQ